MVAPFLTRGVRQAEALICEQLLAEMQAVRQQADLLRNPIWVIVPSKELYEHLAGVLARAGCALGVEILSLHAAAIRLHEEAGQRAESHALPVEILARRAAEQQPVLRARLSKIQDGMGLAASSIRDVLSARASKGEHPIQLAAQQVRQQMDELGLSRPGDVQERAAALVADHCPARKVWIYGFADATGQACQLLRQFLAQGARLVLDLPCDPAVPDREDRGCAFARDFARRLGCEEDVLAEAAPSSAPTVASQWKQLNASGSDDEARSVAQELRRLLDSGVEADSIGVVVRQLDSYAVPLRRWLTQLGVPFRSKKAPAALFPAHRRLRAALDVLRLGAECPIDRWLDASPIGCAQDRLHDLRLMFRSLSLTRLGQVHRFDVGRALAGGDRLKLPVRSGLVDVTVDAESDSGEQTELPFATEQRAGSRSIPAGAVLAAFGAVGSLIGELRDWPKRQSLAEHVARTEQWIRKTFEWRSDGLEEDNDWQAWLRNAARVDLGEVTRSEYLLLLERQVGEFGAGALGGQSGVAVLDVTQARGRSFEHLYLLGLNRGVFPRAIRQDPVLPDSERRKWIAEGCDDLSLSESGHEEERYLFAQLCSAAEFVTLSWQRSDAAGKELPPSPLLQRLWLSGMAGRTEGQIEQVPRLRQHLYRRESDVRIGREWLSLFGLSSDREAWQQVLPLVLGHATPAEAQEQVASVAAARAAVLASFEARPRKADDAARPSPWSGRIGQSLAESGGGYVTALEAYAACPWQSFLAKRLGVEAAPDPMAQLPELDAALVGRTVHSALESLIAAGKQLGVEARRVPEPDPAAIGAATTRAAVDAAEREQIYSPGLQRALADRARPFIDKAIAWEYREQSELQVVACEVRHEVAVQFPGGGQRRLRFVADRVDEGEHGWVFTDYKTAKPMSDGAKLATRQKHLHDAILKGRKLQAGAYAASADQATGRYLFLRSPRSELSENSDVRLNSESGADAIASFHESAGLLLASQESGIAFARFELSNTKVNPACAYCELSDACHRYDSTVKRNQVSEHNQSSDELDQAIWRMPANKLGDAK